MFWTLFWNAVAIACGLFVISIISDTPTSRRQIEKHNERLRQERAQQGQYPTTVHKEVKHYYLTQTELNWFHGQLQLAGVAETTTYTVTLVDPEVDRFNGAYAETCKQLTTLKEMK